MPIPAGFEHIVRENEPLAPYTWLRLGGPAQYFAEPTNVEELSALVRQCHRKGSAQAAGGAGDDHRLSGEIDRSHAHPQCLLRGSLAHNGARLIGPVALCALVTLATVICVWFAREAD